MKFLISICKLVISVFQNGLLIYFSFDIENSLMFLLWVQNFV